MSERDRNAVFAPFVLVNKYRQRHSVQKSVLGDGEPCLPVSNIAHIYYTGIFIWDGIALDKFQLIGPFLCAQYPHCFVACRA
ncbi:hypothetical protein [Falsochrobactrum ovis]|uniref:hypothetical protein n=1 Tax=Falsochrobactrum ovis TaxID=1293442 RepID=UPI001314F626|nr:hypothetical protein [Falsochrobactrum ovis]